MIPEQARENDFPIQEWGWYKALRAGRSARIAAGMGFWRLVFVVAFGILLAQLTLAAGAWLLARLTIGS